MEPSNAKGNEIKRLNLVLLGAAGIAFLVAVWTAVSNQMRGGTDDLFFILVCLMLAGLFAINPLIYAKQNGMFAASAEEDEPMPALESEEGHHGGSNRENIIIWGGLLALTGVEVVLAYIHLNPALMLIILMLLSVVKAAMIVAYFMHLKFERFSLVMTIVPTLIVLFLLFGIFFPDSNRARNLRPAMEVQEQPAEQGASADEGER